MFEHSVKVPRQYKVAANIVKKVATEGGSVKTLLYDDKLRHFRTNVLYALITETIKHAADIDKIFEHCELLQNEPRFNPWLAKVLTAELLFGKKTLPGKSKPEQTILSYREQFEKYASEHQDDLRSEDIPRPRYVRINTNLLTTSDAIRAFQDEGFKFIRCTSGSYSDYLDQIQKLTEYDFTQDYHVKTVFVFAPGTKWHDHELYLDNQVILQDKATTLAVHLLAPAAGSVVLDMCAAPGMKTTQLAAYMRNEGKIYAVERNSSRYETLCQFVEKTGCKCVQTYNKDSLDIKRGEFEDTEYILLDPSCSGSGMTMSVHNYVDANRLSKLTSLQEKFLKHAMNAFPKAKRIVYSTCSLYPEENERVVTNIVMNSRSKWRVQDVKELLKGQWHNYGSAMYGSIGTRCLYAKSDSDLTTGFFLAVIERDEKELVKASRQDKKSGEIKADKSKTKKTEEVCDRCEKEVDIEEVPKKKKDKNKKNLEFVDEESQVKLEKSRTKQTEEVLNDGEKEMEIDDIPKKKDSKRSIEVVNEESVLDIEVPKKKKKKDEHKENSNEDTNIGEEISTKKNKRKKNNEESLSTVIANLEDLIVEQDQPKKKKRKSHNEEIQVNEDFSSSLDKKKSKKKKMIDQDCN